MYSFKLEPEIALLTVTRFGFWSINTVQSYEVDLRRKLVALRQCGAPTSFIIDIRSSGAQPKDVADALQAMVAGLGSLHADKTAVVTSSGIAKLQAKRVADDFAQVFTSMVLARDWVTGSVTLMPLPENVENTPSDVEAEGALVHVRGPADVDITFTPSAALVTAKRIGDAATEALIADVNPLPPRRGSRLSKVTPNG